MRNLLFIFLFSLCLSCVKSGVTNSGSVDSEKKKALNADLDRATAFIYCLTEKDSAEWLSGIFGFTPTREQARDSADVLIRHAQMIDPENSNVARMQLQLMLLTDRYDEALTFIKTQDPIKKRIVQISSTIPMYRFLLENQILAKKALANDDTVLCKKLLKENVDTLQPMVYNRTVNLDNILQDAERPLTQEETAYLVRATTYFMYLQGYDNPRALREIDSLIKKHPNIQIYFDDLRGLSSAWSQTVL